MFRKALVLALAFVIPGSVFLFLKYFGKNVFNIETFYNDKPPRPHTSCGIEYNVPYRIPQTSEVPIAGISVVSFLDGISDGELNEYSFQLKRLQNEFSSELVNIFVVDTLQHNYPGMNSVLVGDSALARERDCIFVMEGNFNAVLVDSSRQIRGYYSATQKEVERLIVELKVLLKAGENE